MKIGLHSRVLVESDRLAWRWLARARGFRKARVQQPVSSFDAGEHASTRSLRRDQLRQVVELSQENLPAAKGQARQVVLTFGQGRGSPIPKFRQFVADRREPELYPAWRSIGLHVEPNPRAGLAAGHP